MLTGSYIQNLFVVITNEFLCLHIGYHIFQWLPPSLIVSNKIAQFSNLICFFLADGFAPIQFFYQVFNLDFQIKWFLTEVKIIFRPMKVKYWWVSLDLTHKVITQLFNQVYPLFVRVICIEQISNVLDWIRLCFIFNYNTFMRIFNSENIELWVFFSMAIMKWWCCVQERSITSLQWYSFGCRRSDQTVFRWQ